MNDELTRTLEKMYKKRLLSKGIRQIEDFERMNLKVREFDDIESIVPLCSILVEKSECGSATEEVVETIAILVDNHKGEAITEVIKATPDLVQNGHSWVIMLYRMIFYKLENVYVFRDELKKVDNELKIEIESFLEALLNKNYISKEVYEIIVERNVEEN